MLNKKVIFVIKCMTGGGAERVLSLIASAVAEKDIDVKILLTHQKLAEADIRDVETKNGIEIISVSDNAKETFVGSILKKVLLFVVRIILCCSNFDLSVRNPSSVAPRHLPPQGKALV